jgi:hypothetical protein
MVSPLGLPQEDKLYNLEKIKKHHNDAFLFDTFDIG